MTRVLQVALIMTFLLLGAGALAGSMQFKDDQWTGQIGGMVSAVLFALAFISARVDPRTALFQRQDRKP